MDWVPIVFGAFKVIALCIGMFFSIKWHYDQGKKGNVRVLLRNGAMMTAGFVVVVLGVGYLAFELSSRLGLNLSY